MDFVRDELEIVVTNLRKIEQKYIEELDACPPGNLINNRSCGNPRYYHSYYTSDGSRRRIQLPDGHPLIETLARKEFLRVSVPAIRENIRLLNNVLNRYCSLDPADIIASAKRAYRLLPRELFFTGRTENDLWETVADLELLTDDLIRYRCEDHREWADQDYQKNSYEYNGLHLTSFGLRVRSRGEIIIAEQAHTLGIPFRYDQVIRMEDGSELSPDFTFEDKYYEEFYIEYCGMMDDPFYVRRHLIKRGRYERNGVNEWNNIRYIYSTDDSLNAAEVKHILLDWVVPKL